MMTAPTRRTYSSLDRAYDHFNKKLFSGKLPTCLITVRQHPNSKGYYSHECFRSYSDPRELTDEIAMNPRHFEGRSPAEILSTLVHEMVHLWQCHFGNPSRNRYHNTEWAEKMIEVGLIPSATGKPGGKQTGQRVTHYIAAGGRFEIACKGFLENNEAILYQDSQADEETAKKKAASKTKYTCSECGQNAWAKPDANLICGDCQKTLISSDVGK
jgi:predicted SprT family Zn-dependent metalloprotease